MALNFSLEKEENLLALWPGIRRRMGGDQGHREVKQLHLVYRQGRQHNESLNPYSVMTQATPG